MIVTIAELKTHLSKILRKAAEGEEIIVIKEGRPYVAIKAAETKRKLPRVGAFEGQMWMAEDFDELGPEWDEYTKS